MKIRFILILSVMANAALLAGYWFVRPAPPPSAPAAEPAPVAATPRTTPKSAAENRPTRVVSVVTNDFQWAQLESEDYREYIARLRSIGCPEETIRDIIIADVNKLYAGRIAALYPSPADFEFWKSNNRRNNEEARERMRQERELEREKRTLIKELLGVDLERELAKWEGRPDDEDRQFGFLPPEKQEALRALQARYRELARTTMGEGGWSPENRAKMMALRAQQEAEMAQLLSPQEYQEYQLRNSWTARNMRESLGSFEPSEAEFLSIFQMRKAFDDQFGMIREGGDETVREQRRLAQQQLDEQIRATLGEQRFQEYQLAQDERYRDIYDFVQRNELPKEVAASVYDIRRAAETERRRVESDQSLQREQRAAAIAAITEQTRQALATTLGPDAFARYQERDGNWLNRIARVENRRGSGDSGAGGERRGGPPGGGRRIRN